MLRRIESGARKFNRWFGISAVAANTEQGGRVINAMDVSAVLTELKSPPTEKPPSS